MVGVGVEVVVGVGVGVGVGVEVVVEVVVGVVMINRKFIKETDNLIQKFKERGVKVYNGNLIVAKVKADRITKGGLVLPDEATQIDDFHNGLARILAVAENADSQYKPGLYIVHSHEARYKIFEDSIRETLGTFVDKDSIYAVQDNNVLFAIESETVQKAV